MNDLLLDTNILVYAIDEDSQFFSKARTLLDKTNQQLYTTSKNLTEFLAVTTRGQNAPLSVHEALTVVDDYITSLNILFPNTQSLSILRELISKYHPTGLKMHDFDIISIALAHKVSQIATFDIRGFRQVEEIEVISV